MLEQDGFPIQSRVLILGTVMEICSPCLMISISMSEHLFGTHTNGTVANVAEMD